MPSYTHLRRAQPVLVAHFFLSHAAALRRDYARLAAAADEADALTLGSGAFAGTSYPVDTERLARALGFSRVVLNSMDASSDRDFVASFLYAVSAGDGASQQDGGRPDHLHGRGARLLRTVGCVGDRQQHDAAEEEPGSAGARARQDRTGRGQTDRLARDDEGAARAGTTRTCRKTRRRSSTPKPRSRRRWVRPMRWWRGCPRTKRGPPERRRACCLQPMWPTILRHEAFPFVARTKWLAPWSAACSRRDATSVI